MVEAHGNCSVLAVTPALTKHYLQLRGDEADKSLLKVCVRLRKAFRAGGGVGRWEGGGAAIPHL